MVEGQGSDDYRLIKTMLYARPDLLHHILEINAQATLQYLNAQIDAGAQAVMLFDSWGGVLADGLFQQFSLAYTRKVVAGLARERRPPRAGHCVHQGRRAVAGTDRCLRLRRGRPDWTVDLAAARRRTGDSVAFQGNLDPMALFCGGDAIRTEARRVLDAFGPVGKGHVFNLGHGISRFTPPEAVAELVDEVHRHSRSLRDSE